VSAVRIVRIGDRVTWAGCALAETVIEIRPEGVVVDWRGGHFVAWDGWSHAPMLGGIGDEVKASSYLRFDNKDGDRVDPASYAASLS
jgi:hypothetical protein